MKKLKNEDSNIFDLDNLEGVSDSIKGMLTRREKYGVNNKILSLFSMKPELTIDEVIIALYRKYKIEKKRIWYVSSLSIMAKKGMLIRISFGKYKKS